MAKKKGLGKGLDELFIDNATEELGSSSAVKLKLSEIEPNKNQPRKNFDEEALAELKEIRAELIEDLGSADELKHILADYQAYNELINADTTTSDALKEYQAQLDYIRELLNSSKNKEYIVKIAKDELNLYFADEEIIYNDIN